MGKEIAIFSLSVVLNCVTTRKSYCAAAALPVQQPSLFPVTAQGSVDWLSVFEDSSMKLSIDRRNMRLTWGGTDKMGPFRVAARLKSRSK
ncbi:hypothetical protein [Parasedimentitalea psychrophila]|uniref:Uncharacterized protein n=1 Tax=Parasedimentitalea psychrophila TaxID=2997337 RepID=A0A9Y2L3S8_9RHOB|nr:hypothetical protein [Parasedimentitalea psychrophila]WIY27156.1 hypothetical protein QPJ95_09705 [Parasedimentitalea psychrophila]